MTVPEQIKPILFWDLQKTPPSEQNKLFLFFTLSEIATGCALATTVRDVPRDFVEQFLGNTRIIPADFLSEPPSQRPPRPISADNRISFEYTANAPELCRKKNYEES